MSVDDIQALQRFQAIAKEQQAKNTLFRCTIGQKENHTPITPQVSQQNEVVFAVCGRKPGLPNNEILEKLLSLNLGKCKPK